jgi:hypothetical protein
MGSSQVCPSGDCLGSRLVGCGGSAGQLFQPPGRDGLSAWNNHHDTGREMIPIPDNIIWRPTPLTGGQIGSLHAAVVRPAEEVRHQMLNQACPAMLLAIRRIRVVAGLAVAAEREVKRIHRALRDAGLMAEFHFDKLVQRDQKRFVMVKWVTADNLDNQVPIVVEKPITRRFVTHLALRKTLNDYFRKCHLTTPPPWLSCNLLSAGL